MCRDWIGRERLTAAATLSSFFYFIYLKQKLLFYDSESRHVWCILYVVFRLLFSCLVDLKPGRTLLIVCCYHPDGNPHHSSSMSFAALRKLNC